jgi:tetratricopeptide (TPR) repeat protein
MKFLILLATLFAPPLFATSTPTREPLVDAERLQLTKGDHIIAEHLVNMIKFVEKGYVNQEILVKVTRETEKSRHFANFTPWLREIATISRLGRTEDFLSYCRSYMERRQTLPLERRLERLAGNYCRERALEAIGRDIERTKVLNDDSTMFIQQNLKFFLTKRNKKNFAFFIQSQVTRPEILKKLSQEVTTYSVRHELVPSQEVLKDIVINEQITKLIQDKGFNPLQHQNVFYAEYGKLIELGYRVLDNKPTDDKVKDHYQFLKNYLELNQDHLPLGLCLTRMNDFAKAVFRGGHKKISQEIFRFIITKNEKEVHEDALFFYLWTHLYHNEFKEAHKLAAQHGLIKNAKQLLDARLKFWIGIIHEELGNPADAVVLYEDIVFNHPLSYYAIMSTKKLQVLKPESLAVGFYVANSGPTAGRAPAEGPRRRLRVLAGSAQGLGEDRFAADDEDRAQAA